MAYLNGVDSNGVELKEKFLKETEAHTLTIDLRVVRMRPTVEGKRINPTAAFNEIIGVESVDAYYKLLLDVLEAVADQSDTNSPLKIFAFGGVPHSKMKTLLNDRESDKLTIDPELFEMHPEALIGGRGLKNLGADTPIEDIVANSITVCSRKEAYLRSDRALQERLKGLGIDIEVKMYEEVYDGSSAVLSKLSEYRSQQSRENYHKSWAPFAAAMSEDRGTYFEGLSDLGLLGRPINSPEWNDLSTQDILDKIALKRSENGQAGGLAAVETWR
jgi:hypothetical protein